MIQCFRPVNASCNTSQYFSLAGGTDDSTNHKHGFLHSGMGSKLIILDPELCLTTPPYHWLSTGVRSLDHCVEALCCLSATTKSDSKAEEGLRLLAPGLLRCQRDTMDVEARQRCQLAVGPAMDNVRAGIPMGGSHAIGHQLGMWDALRLAQYRADGIRPTRRPSRHNQLHHVSCCDEVQHQARRR